MVDASDRQRDLFGEPARTAEHSQFFTPAWVARRAARWLLGSSLVVEPNAGRGNLIDALLRAGHPRSMIAACELDPAWCVFLRQRWSWLDLREGDFLKQTFRSIPPGAAALMNPPYEDDQDVRHIAHAIEIFGRAVAIVKSDFEFSAERDRVLWSRARVVRRGICVDRPDFGGTVETGSQGASRNYVALDIRPAADVGGAYTVREERWRKSDPEADW